MAQMWGPWKWNQWAMQYMREGWSTNTGPYEIIETNISTDTAVCPHCGK